MPDELAPPVVAVVVSSDPGPWLEEGLSALLGQDYGNLSILVVDAASAEPLAERVAAVAPQIFLIRLEDNRGFGPNANAVLGAVQGASHLLFCHDDVVLAPDALRRLVEEAFRSNAGIVAPKLVDYDDPERLLQLGLGVDRYGAPVRRVVRGEFDQAQHDEVREVFAVPGGCTLVRSDLFGVLHGFDDQISMLGEDVDLCWRARLAGARIVVVPLAVVRHREATASRLRPLPAARDLQWRHELRSVLKNYGRLRRALVVAQLALLSIVEVLYFYAANRRRRAHQVIDAWKWNLAPERDLSGARAAVAASRRLPDRVVCALFSRRTSRLWRFLRPALEDLALHWSGRIPVSAEAEAIRARRRRRPREVVVGAGVVLLFFLFGSRSVLFGHLPLIGQYAPFPSPAQLFGHFFGGYNDAGMQSPGPASPAFFFLGVLGIVSFGAMGLAQKILVVALIALGAIGLARLVRPFGSHGASLAGAAAYLFVPLGWNELAIGDLQGLVAFAGCPYVLGRLARAAGIAPYRDPSDFKSRSVLYRDVVALGVLLAVIGSIVPLFVLDVIVLGLCLAIGAIVAGQFAEAKRTLYAAFGSALTAGALLFPWAFTFFQSHTSLSVLLGAETSAARLPQLGTILRLDLGPIGKGVLGWAFFVSALFVVLVGTGERLSWAIRFWAVLLGSAAIAWALAEGWLGSGGEVGVLLAPIAVSIAFLVALGVQTVPEDLRRTNFGLGHVAAVLFCVSAAAGLLPVLDGSLSGRWGLPDAGYDSVLSWTNPPANKSAEQRVLYLGDPAALPLSAWQIRPGLAAAVAEGGLPEVERLWLSPNPSLASSLMNSVRQAESGLTVQLGASLERAGIRYVVVPSNLSPLLSSVVPTAPLPAPPPQELLDGLAAQSDLHELPDEGGALVFENTAWRPFDPQPSSPALAVPAPIRAFAMIVELLAFAFATIYLIATRESIARRVRSPRRERDGTASVVEEPEFDELVSAP